MAQHAQAGRWVVGGLGLAVGLVLGLALAPDHPTPVNPQLPTLDADLWMQTAGEYRACCLQAYRLASDRLAEKLRTAKRDPARPLAVVFDLDETVLDNSGFQSYLFEATANYSDEAWKRWERESVKDPPGAAKSVPLLPGAKAFIEECHRQGVVVVYLSNRFRDQEEQTVEALRQNGLNVEGIQNQLLLAKGDEGKEERQEEVRKRYVVLLWLGDNLRDFDDRAFRYDRDKVKRPAGRAEEIARRLEAVQAHQDRWGDDWIVLPNPTYGEWRNLLGGRPADYLRPSPMKRP